MSVPFVGGFTRSAGEISAIAKQIKLISLRGVRRITVKFDPFHESANNTRLVEEEKLCWENLLMSIFSYAHDRLVEKNKIF